MFKKVFISVISVIISIIFLIWGNSSFFSRNTSKLGERLLAFYVYYTTFILTILLIFLECNLWYVNFVITFTCLVFIWKFNYKNSIRYHFDSLFILFIMLYYILLTIVYPSNNYDSLAYHYSQIGAWLKNQKFTYLKFLDEVAYYPYSWELLSSPLVLLFKNDLFIQVFNSISWGVLFLLLYVFFRKYEKNKIVCWLWAYVLVNLPLINKILNSLHVEIGFLLFFLLTIYWGLNYFQSSKLCYLVLAFLSLCIIVSIKVSGIEYALIIGIYWLIYELIHRKDKIIIHGKFHYWLWIGIGIFIAEFWYINNLLRVGNPLGLVELKIGSKVLFKGTYTLKYYAMTSLIKAFNIFSREHWKLLFNQVIDYLGIFWFICFILWIMRLDLWIKRWQWMLFVLLLLLVYLKTPFTADNGLYGYNLSPIFGWNFRYGFPFVFMVSLTVFIHYPRLRKYLAGYGIYILTSFLFSLKLKIFLLALLILILIIIWYYLTKVLRIVFLIVCLAFSPWVIEKSKIIRYQHKVKLYGNWYKIVCNLNNQKIGFFDSHIFYLFWGENFSNEIYYISEKGKLFKKIVNDYDIIIVGPLYYSKWEKDERISWLRNNSNWIIIYEKDKKREPIIFRRK